MVVELTRIPVDDPDVMLDLTVLLATGRAPESLTDYLGSGDRMTERVSLRRSLTRCKAYVLTTFDGQGIQKWETTVTDALQKLRDFSSQRVAPAFQRIHVLLQEVQGWAQL